MRTVLIIGGGLQGVSTARSLKTAGYKVGIWCPKNDYACKSSALSFKGCGDINTDLIPFLNQNKVDVIIPMSDEMTLFLSSNKNKFESEVKCKIAVPELDVLKIASNKLQLMKFCRDKGFPHPETLSDRDLKEKSKNNFNFPALIKPNHSVGSRGITKVYSHEELLEKLPIIKEQYGDCHIQEYIGGERPYYNVMLYRAKSGNCLGYSILKIIRFYPTGGGSSSMCQTVDDPTLVNLCMSVLTELNYVGFADFDVLQTENNEYKIIEINPRVPASLRGAAVSGVNFPAIICGDALGESIPETIYRPGKTLRYLGLDVMWFLSSPNRFKSKPSWFKFFGRNIFYQEGGWQDLRPMLASLWSNLNKLEFKNWKIQKKPLI